MRKFTLLLSALSVTTMLSASAYDYEFTPVVGGVWKEGNLNLDNELLVGGEFQFNDVDFFLKPEVSLLYSPSVDYDGGGDTDITRFMINGVHEYKTDGGITPFAKVGLGYEHIADKAYKNVNSCFVDAGAGVKFPLTETLALKAEAIYMLKRNDNRWDNNLAALVGLTFSFGAQEESVLKEEPAPQEEPKEEAKEEAVVAAVAVLDADNDGVKDAKDKCPTTPAGVKVDVNGCCLDGDNDGVADHKDKCPTTQAGRTVDENGCELDSDNDGVVDALDKCPDTVPNVSVDVNGCAESIVLAITFENASSEIDEVNSPKLQEYVDFMKRNTAYNAVIVGHTDSRGSAKFNQKLSQERAAAVVNDLVKGGVDASRLEAVGKGEDQPVADNATAEGRAQNRRIEAQLKLQK